MARIQEDPRKATLREALKELLRSSAVSEIIRPYYARESAGWLRVIYKGNGSWKIRIGKAPGNAYSCMPGEVFIDIGVDTDANVLARYSSSRTDAVERIGDRPLYPYYYRILLGIPSIEPLVDRIWREVKDDLDDVDDVTA